MEVGIVRVAEDKDFNYLQQLLDDDTDWKLDYNRGAIKVWTKNLPNTNFKMVKVIANFCDIPGEILFDVLHDPEYRKEWDAHMVESHDIGYINPNNDVGYYSMSCPSPLNRRDFVLQRSWLDMGHEKYILNHSVNHAKYPPRKGYIRATSYLTGFLIRTVHNRPGCSLGYISQTDPRGQLPPWLVNRVTQILGPKMVKNLQKASWGYADWKARHKPYLKPWLNPEQITAPRLDLSQCNLPEPLEDVEEPESYPSTSGDIHREPRSRSMSISRRLSSSSPSSPITGQRSNSIPIKKQLKSPDHVEPAPGAGEVETAVSATSSPAKTKTRNH